MSWHLINEIFPSVVSYSVNYKATDYQTLVKPYYLNSVCSDTAFKAGDTGLIELKVTLVPSQGSSPFAPKALLKSLVPDNMMTHLKEFNSKRDGDRCFVDLLFVFPGNCFDTTIIEICKESFESKFTEQLEQELTKSE